MAFSVSHTIMIECVCKVITCRSPLLTFGNLQDLVIQSENENCNHPGNTLGILIKFIINASQYCSTYSEVPPISDALYFNVYAAPFSTIQIPVYVAAWLLNWFKGFSLWDLTCGFASIKLDKCRHVECSVVCLVIRTNHKSAYIQLEQKKACEFCNRLKRNNCISLGQCCSTCFLKDRENSEKIKIAKVMECDIFAAQLSHRTSSVSVDIYLAVSIKNAFCMLVEMFYKKLLRMLFFVRLICTSE